MFKSLLILSCLLVTFVGAASTSEKGLVSNINNGTINTMLIFTSQEGLNSGTYYFTNTPVDLKMEILHLPFTYHFHSDSDLSFFIVGNGGYGKITLNGTLGEHAIDMPLNNSNKMQIYTLGIGGGVRYQLYEKLYFSLGTEFIYSRAGASIKSDNLAVEDFFNRNYSNNLTYKFFALVEYRPVIQEHKAYITLGHKLYETKSSFALKDLVSFDSSSSVTTLALGIESAPLYERSKYSYLTLETYFNGHILDGVVRDVTDVKRYGSIGAISYWNTLKDPWWASRFYLEAALVTADGLEGYNVGVGFTIDF